MAVKKKAVARKKVTVAVPEVAQEAVAAPDPVPEAARAPEPLAAVTPVAAKKSKNLRYVLPSNMEIAALGQVHADLLAMSSGNDGPYILDGAQLSVIDAAGLQLLVSFVKTVHAEGKKVSWENYSVQAYQLANEIGVVEQIGD